MKEVNRAVLLQLAQLKAPGGCPSVATLGDFLDGKGTTDGQSLETHLRSCPSCLNRLIDLQELAVLQREGEAPSRELSDTVKQLVPAQEQQRSTVPAYNKQMSTTLAKAWETFLEWTTLRFFGELAAAVATALFLVVVGRNLFQPGLPPPGSEQMSTWTEFSMTERKLLTSLATTPTDIGLRQIAETLVKFSAPPAPDEVRGEENLELYKKAVAGTVLIKTESELGSGSVISSKGEVLTNWHVIQGAKQIVVYLKSPKEGTPNQEFAFTAVPIKLDRTADLALVQLQHPPADLQPLALGDRESIEIGQNVHGVGHPQGETWSYTTGDISWISAADYTWGEGNQGTVIKTGASVNPGNTGGPLLNDQAQIIGVNTFIKEGEGQYAVAIDVITSFLQKPSTGPTVPSLQPGASSPSTPPPSSWSRSGAPGYRAESFGKHIIGVYMDVRVPPPDVWMVYRDVARRQPSYVAKSSGSAGHIDTVVVSADPQPHAWAYYFDTNCDGLVDLVGSDADSNGMPERYSSPTEPLRLESFANELVAALRDGTIPYLQVQVCHEEEHRQS